MNADLQGHIRRYEPPDENAVWLVHDRAFRLSDLEFYPELNRHLRHIQDSYLDPGGEFLVAVADVPPAEPVAYGRDGERVVGVGGFVPSTCETASLRPDSPVSAGDRTVVVKSVRVDPDFQRRGIARSLMAELEARARDAGFERSVLDTGEDLTAAQSLYESLGYEVVGRETVAGFGLVFYEKRL